MITTNYNLNALDALFTAAERIERYDPVAVGRTIIDKAVIAAAIIIGVATYIITALQLWWCDNGDRILTFAVQAIINTIDFSRELFILGQQTRRVINTLTARAADTAFYAITA